MVVQHSGDQKPRQKNHSCKVRIQWVVGGRFKLDAVGESSVLHMLSIHPCQLAWSPSRQNVLYCRLTEAIISVAHHDPQPPATVSGPAQPPQSIRVSWSAVIMKVKITCTAWTVVVSLSGPQGKRTLPLAVLSCPISLSSTLSTCDFFLL